MKLELRLMDSLKSFRERVAEEREQRVKQNAQCLSFGVPFLDESLAGIYSNDLIVVGAKTGIGKTQLATIAAMTNAALGKRVHFFALEAEPSEIERRIKYQVLAEAFFKSLRKDFPDIHLNYMDWVLGRFDSRLGKAEDEIELLVKDMLPGLSTFYRTAGEYTVEDFEKAVLAIQDQTDLIICDHLHYFDYDPDENENRALKHVVKKIRDLALLLGKPVMLVAHLRKSDRRIKQIAPGVDEFHGSSDITKIATKVITLAPCPQEKGMGNTWPTYARVAKCRTDGSRTKYVGLLGFNADANAYQKPYYLGRLSAGEDEFEPIRSFRDLPHWAKSAQFAQEGPV